MAQGSRDLDDKVDGLSLRHVESVDIQGKGFVVDLCRRQQSGRGADHEGTDSVALSGFMIQASLDADRHRSRRHPAPDRGVLAVVARMATGGGELHPNRASNPAVQVPRATPRR